MANLLSILQSSADAMGVFQKQLQVAQNNVSNASTPGYARQRILTIAKQFDPDTGPAGGVVAGPMQNARSRFAEDNVQRQVGRQGMAQAQSEILASLESAFPVGDGQGIAGALNGLMNSFSNWSVAPNDGTARQGVLDQARGLAATFRDAAATLSGVSQTADRQLQGKVDEANSLAAQLRDCNLEARKGASGDAGLDARMNDALEQLAQIVDFTVIPEADGSMTVLAGGTVPLVVGNNVHPLQLSLAAPADDPYPDGPARARILDDAGNDVTDHLKGGEIAGTLQVRNQVIGGLIGDTQQEGELNRLAAGLAGRINAILGAGQTADGSTPPEDLFQYDDYNLTAAARTLDVNPNITPAMLAAADPGPPYASNGTALKLASLAQSQDPADQLDSTGFVQFYAGLAASVGRSAATATQESDMQAQLVAQARNMRQDTQGVSLDAEAISVLEYQRAYEAAAQVLKVLDQLTETTVNLLN